MKKLILSALIVSLALTLQARENPFIMYDENSGQTIETPNRINTQTDWEEANFINSYQNKNNKTTKQAESKSTVKKQEEKTYSKKEVDSLILKTRYQNEQKTKQLLNQVKNKEPEQIVYVKPRTDINEELLTQNILPFIKLGYSDNKLIIESDDLISKKFTINKENKIVVDFKGRKNFTGKRTLLDTSNFKAITIGNHSKNGFYRVVIELNSRPVNFDINYLENSFIISPK